MSRRVRTIQPEDYTYCDKATGQFSREYPAKFLEGAARNNAQPFVKLANVVQHAKEEVLDQWSYLTLIEDRVKQAKAKLHVLRSSVPTTLYADVVEIINLLP